MTLAVAYSLIDRLAKQVGFEKSTLPQLDQGPDVGTCAILYTASYAQLLVIEAPTSGEQLREAARRGQEWLDLACIERERQSGQVVDGYLLVLLATPPDRSIAETVRELELNPTTCRKHFAWPELSVQDEDLAWSRVYRVTSIGIPPSPEFTAMTGTPILDSSLQINILTDIKDYKGRESARRHAETPSQAPEL
jgi:hypothetical protein